LPFYHTKNLSGDRLWGESVDNLGDRCLVEIRGDRCFGVVGLLRGDRLCAESVDILGEHYQV
jgi:hypothetical protein